jgi:PKD repeat protein
VTVGAARLKGRLGRTRIVLAAMVAVVAVLALGAGQAGAVVTKVNGHGYGITPRSGVDTSAFSRAFRASRAASAGRVGGARNFDGAPFGGGALEWLGGPVMHSVTTHVIYWDPNSEFHATTKSIVQSVFTDVQHDSGKPTNVFAIGGQYTDSTGHAAYSSTFAGALTDSNAYPTSGTCTVPAGDPGPPYTKCLFDSQLQTQLSTFINEHGLPKGPSQQYFLLLPHKVATCFPEEIEVEVGVFEEVCSNNFFCAYHSYISPGTSNEIIYSDIPFSLLDSVDAKGCQDDGHEGQIQQPNPDNEGGKDSETRFADVALKYISHEYTEAATDPLVNNQTAWVDENGLENGDKCNGVHANPEKNGIGYDANSFTPTLGGKASTLNLFNQSINAGHFYLQSEWDNPGEACLMKPLELTEPGVSAFSLEGIVGEPVTFEGTVEDPYEDPEFSWDFGDGTEGTGETPEHTYAAPGTYKVTMTPTDGLTGATSPPATMTFTVDEPPIAAFTFAPSKPAEGGAVKFDAETSEDPDGSITEYAWSFGDGKTGSGEKPENTYAAPGLYTVTLTVTDSTSQEASVTHQVAVSGHPVVKTEPPGPVSSTSATLNAKVNPNGLNVTQCKFEYGPTTEYGSTVACSSLPGAGTADVSVSATLLSLAPSTTLHYRIVAENSASKVEGADEKVITVAQPAVTTGSASSVTSSSATLAGSVNPKGASVTQCKFEYGTTAAYGSSAACGSLPGSGSSSVAVSAALSALSANTTYHYRLVAANAGGAVQGSDQTFTTLMSIAKEAPTAPPSVLTQPPPPPAATSAFASSATFNAKTGAITLTLTVGDPGTLSWLATFQNRKFGVFAASVGKCKKGQVRLGGKCLPAKIVFAKGRRSVAGAGKVMVVLKPSASATKALRSALKRKASVPVTVTLTFRSSRGAAAVTHTRVVSVKLKKH